MKKISLIGSTGSIGTQTLEVVRKNPDKFQVVCLVANDNVDLLVEQAKEFKPEYVATVNPEKYAELKSKTDRKVLPPQSANNDAVDILPYVVVVACTGINGLEPTLRAIKKGVNVALANKETLVAGGALVTEALKESKAKLLPVDSEHSAIWQSINSNRHEDIEKIILTASGGAFRDFTKSEIAGKNAAAALKHPNWSMGNKVTIDSATLMNKGLELIEATWLFDVTEDKVEIVIHPESVVHSMVAYRDGAVIAQLGKPSMTVPIAYALSYPERVPTGTQRPDFTALHGLNFQKPDVERFPCLAIAREVAKKDFSFAIAMNAANDVAVFEYLKNGIGFYRISDVVQAVLDGFSGRKITSVQDVFALDGEIRKKTAALLR